MSNLTKLIANHEKCTYNIVSNEILLIKRQTENGSEDRLSCGARGLFWTMLNLPNDWIVTEKGLATITGESEYTIKKLLKELKAWGYVDYTMLKNDRGLFTQKVFIIREVLNSDIDIDKCIFSTSSDTKSSWVDFQSVDIQSDGIHSSGFLSQYNNIINNNIENKDLSLNKEINTYTNSEEFESVSVQKEKEHVSHVSNELATSSFSKGIKRTQQDWAACHDKNQEKSVADIMSVKDPVNEAVEKKQKRAQNKNKVEQALQEKGNAVRTLETYAATKLSDMTDEDNETSRAVKLVQQITELNKQVNKTNMDKLKNIEQMQKEADKIIPDMDVSKWFNDFLEVKIQKTGHMAKPTVRLLYEDLKSKACDDKQTMIVMLKEAIRLGWNDFYISDNVQKQVAGLKQVQQINRTNTDEQEEYLTDENGNPIQF